MRAATAQAESLADRVRSERPLGLVLVGQDRPLLEPEWIVAGMIPAVGVTTLTGPPKAGKSALVADLVVAMEKGNTWLGREAVSGHSLILSWEAADSTRRRLEAALATSPGLRIPMMRMRNALTDRRAGEFIRSVLRWLRDEAECQVKVIVVDSLASATRGSDENSSIHVPQAFGVLMDIATDMGVAVIRDHGGGRVLDVERL